MGRDGGVRGRIVRGVVGERLGTGRGWSWLLACALILVGAQACWGDGPPSTPAVVTATRAVGVPTAVSVTQVTATRAATAAPRATPSGGTTPATPSRPTITPTEPRLGLNPPDAPSRPGSPTLASPTPTIGGREATIAQVQGVGPKSPLVGQTVRVRGIVTADFQAAPAQGFFLQEPEPGTTERSTGIFVFQGDRPTPDVKLGDEVTAIGVVEEANDRTRLGVDRAASAVNVNSSGNRLPVPIELRPPAAEAEARAYFERYEGMLVTVPTAIVVGPTGVDGEFTVVRADMGVGRLFQGTPRGAGWRIAVGDGGGTRYELAVGDRVDGLVGPLDYDAGRYKIQQLPEPKLVVQAAERAVPVVAPAGPGEFTVASFDLGGLFDPLDTPGKADPCDRDVNGAICAERVTAADYALKRTKAGQAIRDVLGAPTLVAVQGVESLSVLNELAATPELAPYGYGAALLDGPDPRGSNVGLLYRRERVVVTHATQRNACTTLPLGFAADEGRCSARGDGMLDGHFLAARPPLIVALTVRGDVGRGERPLTLIVNHFAARGGTEPEGRELAARRAEEARLVAGIVNELLAADPAAAIMVVGDLNDFAASEPLRVLTTTTPLRDLAAEVPESARYSFIANGQSQVLDYILATPNLASALVALGYAHLAADYPAGLARQPSPWRVSEHDPPVARFRVGGE